MKESGTRRIIVGITGASGVILGVEILRALRKTSFSSHLIITDLGKKVIELETDLSVKDVESLAEVVYANDDFSAPPASGSFLSHGMIVAPCSIKSLSGIANSYADNLLLRAADVALKERRRLVLLIRETPLHAGHLRLMVAAADLGAQILPPMLSFYHHPKTIDDMVRQIVGKVLDNFGIENTLTERWEKKS